MPFTLIGQLLRDFIFGSFMCKIIPYFQGEHQLIYCTPTRSHTVLFNYCSENFLWKWTAHICWGKNIFRVFEYWISWTTVARPYVWRIFHNRVHQTGTWHSFGYTVSDPLLSHNNGNIFICIYIMLVLHHHRKWCNGKFLKLRRNFFPYRQRNNIGFTNLWPKLFILRVVVAASLFDHRFVGLGRNVVVYCQ